MVREGEGVAWNVGGSDTIGVLATEASVGDTISVVGVTRAVVGVGPISVEGTFIDKYNCVL